MKAHQKAVLRASAAVLAISAFGDNLEILAYVYWPGLIVLGMALQEKVAVPSPPALSFYPSAVLYSKATR